MLQLLNQFDTQLFLFLNGLHAPFLDPLMVFVSGKLSWIPLYLFFLYLIFKSSNGRSQIILILLFVALLISVSDQVSVQAFKKVFERPRPCHEVDLQPYIYMPGGECGGAFGFISSHAANSFAIAGFLFLLLRKHFRWIGYVVFPYGIIVSYSRIYLGVHYPGDVMIGAMVGLLIGWLIFLLFQFMQKHVCPQQC